MGQKFILSHIWVEKIEKATASVSLVQWKVPSKILMSIFNNYFANKRIMFLFPVNVNLPPPPPKKVEILWYKLKQKSCGSL